MRPKPLVLLAAIVLVGGTGIATAATSTPTATVKACANAKGQLGLLSKGHCAKGFKAVSLGTKGPQGVQGIQGIQGIQGVPGPQGPGALSSFMDVATPTSGTTPTTRTIAIPGTTQRIVTSCFVHDDSTSAAELQVTGSSALYLSGQLTASFTGTGSAMLVSLPVYTGAATYSTNAADPATLSVAAGSGISAVSGQLSVIDVTKPGDPVVDLQATVISEDDECLAVVTAIPTSNVGG